MNASDSKAPINEQILEEACGWFIDCNEAELDAAARENFNQWLLRSPEHVRAYLEIASTWEQSSNLTGSHNCDVPALVAAAVSESNVFALTPRTSGPETLNTERPRKRGKRPWRLFVATAAAATAAAALLAIAFMSRYSTYTTRIGEQRSVVLDDGSEVELDTRSQLRVRYSHTERLVELVDGQAIFRVKAQTHRPFTVLSGGSRVRAVGTQFDVYQNGATTTVTVLEGRVAVTPAAETPTLLSAGEQLAVTPKIAPHVTHADVATATAWTQRKLIFDEAPLSEVVAEFNRYNVRQILIADSQLAAYHIRGSFEAGNPDRLLQFLQDRFSADIETRSDVILISRK